MTSPQSVHRTEEEPVLAEGEVHRGICSCCKHEPNCIYLRDNRRPVLQCEEFEGYPVRQVKTTGMRVESSADLQLLSSVEKENYNKYKGLCSICDKRENCVFPKPAGGVWHCEECE